MSFRVNEPQVIHETIDGEVVIINLATGNYYSLRDTGAEIWHLLMSGAAPTSIAAGLGERYASDADAVSTGVSGLVERLVAEGLIVAGDEGSAGVPVTAEGGGGSFAPPVLEKYDDMQDLILLDPVHEVDEEAGWPRAKANGREP